MTCTCGAEISAARLEAIPDATLCTACASAQDVPKTVGFMVWDSKHAPTLEIGTKTAKAQAGRRHHYGPHISFAQQEGMYGVAASTEEARSEPGRRPDHHGALQPVPRGGDQRGGDTRAAVPEHDAGVQGVQQSRPRTCTVL